MKAAVYRGMDEVRVEEVPIPPLDRGELLLRVEACGVCGTDLKKIAHGDLPPPLIFGHEVAGSVAAVGPGVTAWREGDRAVFFHHLPCRTCRYCRLQAYAQCPQYRRVGTTAGFEPAGGGFAEFVKVMPWIVEGGLIKIPDGVAAEEATFVEPVNTCLKGVRKQGVAAGQSVLILGAGPVGLLLLQLARREGATVVISDLIGGRLEIAERLGAAGACDASRASVPTWIRQCVAPEGVDVAFVAAAAPAAIGTALEAVRPAGTVVLFAQTRLGDLCSLDVGQIGKLEKTVTGSYSASVDWQAEAAELVFTRAIQVAPLITHRFPLARIGEALRVASHPSPDSLKVVVFPHGAAPRP